MAKQRAEIEAGKMLRVFELMTLLSQSCYSIEQLANQLDTTTRTIYRYLNLLKELGFEIKQKNSKVWFGTDHYPLFISTFRKEVSHA